MRLLSSAFWIAIGVIAALIVHAVTGWILIPVLLPIGAQFIGPVLSVRRGA